MDTPRCCLNRGQTLVTPLWLGQNAPSGVDASTEDEEGNPPGFGPVDLTVDACPPQTPVAPGQGVLDVQQHSVADIPCLIQEGPCLPLQTPVLQGRPTLKVPRAQPSVSTPRRSTRLAAKPRAANSTLQAQQVLIAKLGFMVSA